MRHLPNINLKNATLLFIVFFLITIGTNAQEIKNITEVDGSPIENVYSMFKDKIGDLWIGAKTGVYLKDKTGKIKLKDGEIRNIKNFHQTRNGHLYAYSHVTGSKESEVAWYNGTKWQKTKIDNTLGAFSKVFFEDHQNNLWAMSEKDIYKINKSKVETFTKNEGIPNLKTKNGFFVHFGYLDDNSMVAISEKDGYSYYDGQKFEKRKIFDTRLTVNTVQFINKSLWVGTDKGIYVWKGNKFEPLDEQPDATANITYIVTANNTIAMISNNTAFIYKNKKWEAFNQNMVFKHVFTDSLNNFWFVSNKRSCYRYSQNGESKKFDIDLSSTRHLYNGENGKMIFLKHNSSQYVSRIYYFEENEFKILKSPKSAYKANGFDFVCIDANNYYMKTRGWGLLHFNGKAFTQITKKNGLLSEPYFCLEKYNGQLWIGSAKGISILKLE